MKSNTGNWSEMAISDDRSTGRTMVMRMILSMPENNKNINLPYFERIVDSNPLLTSKKNPHAHADFPISLSSNKTCSVLPRSFLPALPSSSWNLSKLLLLPKVSHTYFPIFLFLSPIHKPSLGNFPVWACFVFSTQTTAICNFPDSFALIILWSFNVLCR